MKFHLVIAILFLIGNTIIAQDFGYIGKKNNAGISANFSPNISSITALRKTNSVVSKNHYQPSGGFSAFFNHQINPYFFIGAEIELDFSTTPLRSYTSNYIVEPPSSFSTYYYSVTVEDVQPLRTRKIAPTIVFSFPLKGQQAPIGVVNSIGIGYFNHKITSKEIDYSYTDVLMYSGWGYPTATDLTEEAKGVLDDMMASPKIFGNQLQGVRFFMQTEINYPLTRNLLFYVAARFKVDAAFSLLNPVYSSAKYDDTNTQYVIDLYEQRRFTAGRELFNLLQLKAGIKFAF